MLSFLQPVTISNIPTTSTDFSMFLHYFSSPHFTFFNLFCLLSSIQGVITGLGGSMSYVVGLPNTSYKPITNTAWIRIRLCKLQIGCTRLSAASDKVYQLLAHGRWFSPRTPVSSTTKTVRHDIAEILLKVALKHQKSKSIKYLCRSHLLNNTCCTL